MNRKPAPVTLGREWGESLMASWISELAKSPVDAEAFDLNPTKELARLEKRARAEANIRRLGGMERGEAERFERDACEVIGREVEETVDRLMEAARRELQAIDPKHPALERLARAPEYDGALLSRRLFFARVSLMRLVGPDCWAPEARQMLVAILEAAQERLSKGESVEANKRFLAAARDQLTAKMEQLSGIKISDLTG